MTYIPTLKILYGPPGTGKTWRAAREAVAVVEPVAYMAWRDGKMDDRELMDLHEQLVLARRIKWVTFHPSYSYEDFIEGFRPMPGPDGKTMVFEVRPGPFRDICEVAAGMPQMLGPIVGSTLDAIGGSKTYRVISANDQGWLLEVRPERADQVDEVQQKFVTRRTIERSLELGLEPKVFSIPGKATVDPKEYGLEGESVSGSELRRTVGKLLGISSSDLANSAHFGAVASFVKEKRAEYTTTLPVCLVIDEINRADLSRVFGEAVTLLEPDKRIGAEEERRIHLPYSGDERFGVPQTLSVIGTMNTADRSISAMDFAMRRRFTFEEVGPDGTLCPSSYGGVNVSRLLEGLNRRVSMLRSRDHRIGHAALMLKPLETIRSTHAWADDDSGRLRALAYVFRNKVVPLLLEYFHEDWRKVELALGVRGKAFGASRRQLFTTYALEASEIEQFEEVLDVTGVVMAQPAPWWDPILEGGFDSEALADAFQSMS